MGLAVDELPGDLRSWLTRIHPDDKKRVLRRFDAHLEGLTDAFDCDLRIRHKDGTFRPVLSRAHALRHPDGQIYAIVGRIERYSASTFDLDGHKVLSSASIGVVCDMRPYRNVDEIVRDADIAMYHAKQANLPSAYFDQAMYKRASRRQQLEVELRQGLERNEFFLVYQPIVRFGSGTVVGYEALVRWMHPKDGMVPPEVFIGIAEETGLIIPLGEWVMLEACRSILARTGLPNTEPNFYVSVNVSSVQLGRSDFLEQVADILAETNVDPNRLVFEVTESDIMEDQMTAARALARLKELGIRIALDDFGTGYSSLGYIHSLPLDMLKIDGSFVRRLEMDPKSVEIVRTFVNLARSLQLASVSEGVETPDQASILEDLNVSHAQGFYYGEPSRLD